MNERIQKFIDRVRAGDRGGARAALAALTVAELNTPDETGRTLLARFAMENNAAAVRLLLKDGRSDPSVVCRDGKTARELAAGPVRELLDGASSPEFFWRNGGAVPRNELRARLEAGTLAADEAIFDALPDDFTRALLTGKGKVSKRDFEKWMEVDEFPLCWEAQIALLLTDAEYAQKFLDWDCIRSAAEPDEWLSFLRDLPECADEADWDKLAMEGDAEAWQKLLKVRPEFTERWRRGMAKKYADESGRKLLKKYNPITIFNFLIACRMGDAEVVKAHLEAGGGRFDLNENPVYSMPPGFLQELPLAAAVKANSVPCVRLLLAFGADPDARCRKNGKTPRELAAQRPGIRLLFDSLRPPRGWSAERKERV